MVASSDSAQVLAQHPHASLVGNVATMFEILHTQKLQTVDAEIQGPYTVIPGPPAGWIPPIGASSNTWADIYKNKQRIDYCVDQFAYLTNRVK